MNKILLWVVVGALAVAGLSAVVFIELGPRGGQAAPAGEALGSDAESTSAAANASAAPEVNQSAPATSSAAAKAIPTVDELIQNASTYEGMPVALTGTILTQCSAGCEFALDDGTGVLSVQLEGKGKDRLIPSGKVGKTIQVRGVFQSDPRPQVIVEDPDAWQFVKP